MSLGLCFLWRMCVSSSQFVVIMVRPTIMCVLPTLIVWQWTILDLAKQWAFGSNIILIRSAQASYVHRCLAMDADLLLHLVGGKFFDLIFFFFPFQSTEWFSFSQIPNICACFIFQDKAWSKGFYSSVMHRGKLSGRSHAETKTRDDHFPFSVICSLLYSGNS